MLGVYLIMQNLGGAVGASLCGYLVDRVGSWAAIRLGAVIHGIAFLAVLLASWLGLPQPLFLLAFFALGFIGGSSWWGFTSDPLDLATPEQRPTYLATSSIISSPTVITSIAAGLLYRGLGPPNGSLPGPGMAIIAMNLAWRLARVCSRATSNL